MFGLKLVISPPDVDKSVPSSPGANCRHEIDAHVDVGKFHRTRRAGSEEFGFTIFTVSVEIWYKYLPARRLLLESLPLPNKSYAKPMCVAQGSSSRVRFRSQKRIASRLEKFGLGGLLCSGR